MKTMVLDCTLRDGGYCNSWRFGYDNIKTIINGLYDANVDIVECGFLTNRIEYDCNNTRFSTINDITQILKETGNRWNERHNVVMINYGEYDFHTLPNKTRDIGIDGIRLAFHKKDKDRALEQAGVIKEKGYRLFLQPMVSLSYSDSEFLALIEDSNHLKPYAFYIVDSFGMMKRKDLTRLFYSADYNLSSDVLIGFHSHNNMQLAYSNAQMLTEMHGAHGLIIDCSIYGMGRGAGNLNTELFLDYLRETFEGIYDIRPLIRVIDRVLDKFYKTNYWGYSLPNYLSASYNTHPNYAGFLDGKNALNVEDMDAILSMMEDEKRIYFDNNYAEKLYTQYLSSRASHLQHKSEVVEGLTGASVILIAPGKSSHEDKKTIIEYAMNNHCFVISVNHAFDSLPVDYIFLSNLRRFRELDEGEYAKCIATSNIPTAEVYLRTDYCELLNDNEAVRDNAGLMAIRFMIKCNVKEILLAGFDGYSYDSSENYANEDMMLITKRSLVDVMNEGMTRQLKAYSKDVTIKFLTQPRHIIL